MAEKTLFAIVLAAGTSSRFGSQKQLACFDEHPLVAHAVHTVEEVFGTHTVLVAGSEWQMVVDACQPLRGFLAVNQQYREGLASSIKAGIGCVRDCAQAAMLTLADQPLVTSEHLTELRDVWRESPESIVSSAWSTAKGPPVIFPHAYFSALMKLDGDRGAQALIHANANNVKTVRFEPAGIDIDRPEDLSRL